MHASSELKRENFFCGQIFGQPTEVNYFKYIISEIINITIKIATEPILAIIRCAAVWIDVCVISLTPFPIKIPHFWGPKNLISLGLS